MAEKLNQMIDIVPKRQKNLLVSALTQWAGGAELQTSRVINYIVASLTKDGIQRHIFLQN